MSYLIQVFAQSTERPLLQEAAEAASRETGLLVLVDPPPRFLKRWDPSCTVHFDHEDVEIYRDDIHRTEPTWVTRDELVEPLARALERVISASSGPISLEAAFQPTNRKHTRSVKLEDLCAWCDTISWTWTQGMKSTHKLRTNYGLIPKMEAKWKVVGYRRSDDGAEGQLLEAVQPHDSSPGAVHPSSSKRRRLQTIPSV